MDTPNQATTETATPNAILDASQFNAAYVRRLPEITAVPDDDLVRTNFDPQSVVKTILGALPEIKKLRPELQKIPQMNMALVDGLEDYAEAAAAANARYLTALEPNEDITALVETGRKLRETIKSDATALAARGIIDPARLKAFKGANGFANIAFELIDWGMLMSDCWSAIDGKTALTQAEVEEAMKLGERLVRAAGLRDAAPAVVAEVAKIRHQALTLVLKAYDEVQRGIAFLRWQEDDVETIAPSLFANRGNRRPEPPNPPAPNPEPEPGPVTPGNAAATNAASLNAAAPNGTPANGAAAGAASGMPGGSPLPPR